MSWWSYKPYVSAAERRVNAAREVEKLEGKGQKVSPVRLDGKTIARTFWGKAWCKNLESYSDFDNRLPRGRTYVRNGSVCDLQIEPGRVTALVCGSHLYKIQIAVGPVAPDIWDRIKRQCAGHIGSLIELLQGKFSSNVMEIITRPGSGLFPKPDEIDLDCSCLDWADLCKHVAAALHGVGARLDEKPDLLFVLRQVDHLELIHQAGEIGIVADRNTARKTIAADALADVFGIELDEPAPPVARKDRSASKPTRASTAAGQPRASKSNKASLPAGRPKQSKRTGNAVAAKRSREKRSK